MAEAWDLMRWAFGDDVPPRELETWLSASPARKRVIAARLLALKEFVEAGRSLDPARRAALARAAGVGLGRLRNIATHWRDGPASAEGRERRSLEALGVPVARQRRALRATAAEANLATTARLREFEASGAIGRETPIEEAVRLVIAADVDGIGVRRLATVREIVRDHRRAASGRRDFGAMVAFDDVRLEVRDRLGRAFRAMLVIDVSTRVVLGGVVVPRPPGRSEVKAAARDAGNRLRDLRLPGFAAAAGPSRIRVALGGDDAMETLRLFAAVTGWDDGTRLVRGRVAASALGRTLGRVPIRPGWDVADRRAEDPTGFAVVTAEEAETLLALSIDRHNGGLVEAEGEESAAVAARRTYLADLLVRSVAVL